MADAGKGINRLKPWGKLLSRLSLALLCAVALIALALGIYLATRLPARHLSRILTDYLHQNVTVDRVQATGGTLYLRGVRLDNPPEFPKGSLAVADSVVIAPQWGHLLLGRQRFSLIELNGIRIHLVRNSQGAWNFEQLQRLFASKKVSPIETRIKQLTIKDGSISAGDQGVQGIALQLFNVATKGSLDSRVDLGFEDAAGNRFALKGEGRAGADPALDFTLTAPELSLRNVAALLKLKRPELFEGGRGSLQVKSSLHKGELTAAGTLEFSRLRLATDRKNYPLAGNLQFAADYNLQRDAGHLQNCTLTVNDLVKMHAQGKAERLKGERSFALDIGLDGVDLAALNGFLPEEAGRTLVLGGRLGCRALHVAGNGSQGVTSASGILQLHDGALIREGRLLVAGVSGTLGFSRVETGILGKGRLQVAGPRGDALLENLDMPFVCTFSRELKLLKAEIPSLSARVLGTPFSGRLAFAATNKSPLTASLRVPAAKLARLNTLLERYGLHATAGSAAVALEVAGKNLQELDATAELLLSDFHGSRGSNSIAVKKGAVTARLHKGGGHLLLQGAAQLNALAFNGKAGDARFGYRIADRTAYLDDADVSVAGAHVSIAHLTAGIPILKSPVKANRYPIDIKVDGCALKLGGLEVTSLAGALKGDLSMDPAGRWLEGAAHLASGRVNWQGKAVAAPAISIAFSRLGARGELKGELLGGALAGSVSGNPFAPEAGASFDLGLREAELAAAAQFIPKTSGIRPSGGVVELRLNGRYSRRDGLSCRFESKGSRIALAGSGGKTLLSGAAITLAGTVAKEHLLISDAALSPGAGVTLRLKGEINHPLSEKRAGNLTFSLPETTANNIIDPLVNLLPRMIQEATVNGTVAAEGKLELLEGRQLLNGSLLFKGGGLERTTQKLVVAGINGRVPFSLDLSGQAAGKPRGGMTFSRENYPRLLKQLQQETGTGQTVTVSKIAFGPLELGTLTMHVTAENGTTEITALKSSLYEGALLGRGALTMQKGPSYRGDLLVNGLSLKRLCSMFPGIQGYISGRVDGVISISGGTKGLAGLSGFTELWAREGSGEKMLVSKEFLQRLSKQKLSGFFFRSDRPYDQAEIKALLEEGDLTFETLKILHTNFLGVRDLNVSMAPTQNRIALDHLLDSIKQATVRGPAKTGERAPTEPPPVTPEFKWEE